MTRDASSVLEQNRLLSQLLSLSLANSTVSTEDLLVQVSDQVPAGRGLVFTKRIESEQAVLTLPVDTLINVRSYKSFLHPDTLPNAVSEQRLSSAQLLSLLLARAQLELESRRARMSAETTTKHDALQLFVQTLPYKFETVPLTWSLLARPLGDNEQLQTARWKQRFFHTLLHALPPHSQHLERKVRLRFERDWLGICALRDSTPDVLAEPALLATDPDRARALVGALDLDTFLWAWLCVNSRCVFLPLGLADHADNFTLAPMLDMANHTADPALECKVRYAADGGLEMHAPAGIADDACVAEEGGECFITYGPHSNESLLSEYGFVLPAQLAAGCGGAERGGLAWRGSRYVDVLMDEQVERLLQKQGADGEAKIELLQNRGYWGEFTLHPYPEPAHPSHRLVPALRLAALDLHSSTAPKVAKVKAQPGVKAGKKAAFHAQAGSTDLEKWEETLTGYRDTVSDDNEQQARDMLVELCTARRAETEAARQHLAAARSILDAHRDDADTTSDTRSEPSYDGCKLSLAFVQQLLDEEEAVLRLVVQAARDQVEW
ncbi:related to RKM2-ribosomal protein lysine methyltransferase [Sporisorium reilianum f. sp. reilianum]|uniref:Related to RKM2-ribosomal protein lysine methyltransferase n=1 Tax=Sporisorium reilianum f. sp. reilianum TaxID=72559 RepID=A0A2N8UC29_9BASI|nr:related to RKM2-ribosomal protein lysine methyltransferase [Sporisorium reilianum f. sp. reilianum]